MDWIVAIIVGGIAGWLASLVMNRDASMGIFWNVVVGCIGSVVGNLIANQFGWGRARAVCVRGHSSGAYAPGRTAHCRARCRGLQAIGLLPEVSYRDNTLRVSED